MHQSTNPNKRNVKITSKKTNNKQASTFMHKKSTTHHKILKTNKLMC
jgi:hypothetical protein